MTDTEHLAGIYENAMRVVFECDHAGGPNQAAQADVFRVPQLGGSWNNVVAGLAAGLDQLRSRSSPSQSDGATMKTTMDSIETCLRDAQSDLDSNNPKAAVSQLFAAVAASLKAIRLCLPTD